MSNGNENPISGLPISFAPPDETPPAAVPAQPPVQAGARNAGMVRVMLINNDGAGFADYVYVANGTTIGDLFRDQTNGGNPSNYTIRHNRQDAVREQVLQNNDRLSFVPNKIAGQS